MANKSQQEPKSAPEPDRWYNLTLGSSFKDESSSKYCTLRYEFKPASVDKTKPGLLRKSKENRVSVEFQNNQVGKPKVTFEGNSEEYKENDAVLFFDGETLRLERLHRAVKQLRHLRMPGESAATIVAAPSGSALDPRASPVWKSVKAAPLGRSSFQAVPVEVERIEIGEPDNTGSKSGYKRPFDNLNDELPINVSPPGAKNEVEEHRDIHIDDLFGNETAEDDINIEETDNVGFDMNVPHTDDNVAHTDDEIVDVDDSGDEVDKGPTAAEALQGQVNAERRGNQTSSSNSSGSSSSDSDSESSSNSDCAGSEVSVHSIHSI